MIFTGNGFANASNTVAVAQIKSPHNEKPIGKFSTTLLKQAIETAENLGHDSVYLWAVRPLDEDEDAQAVAFTESLDSDVAIGVPPRVKLE